MFIQDLVVNPLKPIFKEGNGNTGVYYKAPDAVIARFVDNYRPESLKHLKKDNTTILYCVNNLIQQLFYEAFKNDIYPLFDIRSGLQWNISDNLHNRLFNGPQQSTQGNYQQDSLYRNWIKINSYGYALHHDKNISKTEALKLMQQDITRFFSLYLNLDIKIKELPKKFLVLRTIGDKQSVVAALNTKSASQINQSDKEFWKMSNVPFGEQFILHLIASEPIKDLQIVDSTGIAPGTRVDFLTPKGMFRNLKLTQQAIAKYQLQLTVEELSVPVLTITEKTINQAPGKQMKDGK